MKMQLDGRYHSMVSEQVKQKYKNKQNSKQAKQISQQLFFVILLNEVSNVTQHNNDISFI